MRKYFLLLIAIGIEFGSLNGLPVPSNNSGQIIKYRVPSKYFKRNETAIAAAATTTSTAEGSNSLYDLLSQIHFGGKVTATSTTQKSTEDDEILTSTTLAGNDDEEVETATEEEQQTDEVKDEKVDANNESENDFLPELIKKVVSEQLEKLADEYSAAAEENNGGEEVDDETTTTRTSITDDKNEVEGAVDDTTITKTTQEEEENLTADDSFGTDDDDDAKVVTTTTSSSSSSSEDVASETTAEIDVTGEKNNVQSGTDPLLGAVSDLLSSILGLQFEQKLLLTNEEEEKRGENENENDKKNNGKVEVDVETTTQQQQQSDTTFPAQPTAAEEMTTEKADNEIDMMIENLASSVGFATEESPSVVIETEQLHSNDDEDDDNKSVETLKEGIEMEMEEMKKIAALRERINQVMDLVKKTEEALKIDDNAGGVVMMEDETADDDVVSGTLKEIHSNFGINDDESVYDAASTTTTTANTDEKIKIKNIETTINESLMNKKSLYPDEEQVFLPNAAKAALHYKYYYDNHDF